MSLDALLSRNDPLSKAPRYRGRLATDPKFDGLDALETQRKYYALASGATTLYTCPTNKRARTGPGVALFHNNTGLGVTVDLHHVASGGSTGSTNKMAATVTVAAGETRLYFDKSIRQVLAPGDSLVANTGGTGLNCWMWALEERKILTAFYGGYIGNLGITETTVMTVPALRVFALESLVVYNPTAGTRVITAHLRESGVAAATANQIESQSLLTLTGYTLYTAMLPTISEGGIFSAIDDVAGNNVWVNGALI